MNPLVRQEVLKKAEKTASQMGPASVVVQKVLTVLDQPTSSAKDVEGVIRYDQTLASRVLRMANSAFYGFGGKISTISQAVVILGLNTLRAVLVAATANKMMNRKLSAYGLEDGEFWRHSVLTAIAAKLIAEKLKWKNPEEAFIAGLLHDLGKLVLDGYLADKKDDFFNLLTNHGMRMDEAEMQLLGIHHGTVGRKIAQNWNFPLPLQEVLAFHHDPKRSTESKELCAVVGLASAAAWRCEDGLGGRVPVPTMDEMQAYLDVLDLPESYTGELYELMLARLKDADSFLQR